MKTFYFNTGVTAPYLNNLSKGQVVKGGTMQIPFDVPDSVPDNAVLKCLCDNKDLYPELLCVEVSNTSMVSKYAFFFVNQKQDKFMKVTTEVMINGNIVNLVTESKDKKNKSLRMRKY